MQHLNNKVQSDYKSRINKVFEYIHDNLDGDLSLHIVAKIAYFSPYHFHRIFKTITGETLNEYVIRQRVEKAASDLLHLDLSITEIGLKYGFNNNSSFSRAFKKYFDVSPSQFIKDHPNKFSKIRQIDSKIGQTYPSFEKYFSIINNIKNWFTMNAKIEIKETEKMNMAYVSCIGPKNMEGSFNTIMKWAGPKGLMNEKTRMLTVYHDSFQVTDANKVRMSAGMIVDEDVKTEGEISLTSIEGGKFIVGSFEIGITEFEKSWSGMFIWMDENGYKRADRDPFEIYHNDYRQHPENKFIVDIYIPIV